MINLLLPHAKKSLRKEYLTRLSVMIFGAVFVVEIFTVGIYMPSYISLSSGIKTLQEQFDEKKSFSMATSKEIPGQLTLITQQLAALRPTSDGVGVAPSRLMEVILNNKPKNIEINAFLFTKANNAITVQLSGVSDTREDLLAFQKTLQTPEVQTVKFGGSFITKQAPIDFVVTVTFK